VGTDPRTLQSVVMSMADDWNIALGESMIAVDTNARAATVDVPVLASLQTWA
jgi:hypothetical protein